MFSEVEASRIVEHTVLLDGYGEPWFNPYTDVGSGELPDAAFLRRENLRQYLLHGCGKGGALLLNSVAGPNDAIISGVPMATEFQLVHLRTPVYGSQTTVDLIERHEINERFWSDLNQYKKSVLVWNWCPFALNNERDSEPDLMREYPSLGIQLLRDIIEIACPIRYYFIGKAAGQILDFELGQQEHSAVAYELPNPIEDPSRFSVAVEQEIGGMVRKWTT